MKTKILVILSVVLICLSFGLGLSINFFKVKENDKVTLKDEINKLETNSDKENNKTPVKEELVSDSEENKEDNTPQKNEVEKENKEELKKEEEKNKETNNSKEETINKVDDSKPEEDSKNNKKEEVEDNSEKVTILKTDIVTEESITYKYGVKITTTKTYEVITYSNSTTEKNETNSKITYDKSTYNATTNELIKEATSIANKNKTIYEEMLSYVNVYRSEIDKNSLEINNDLNVTATLRALELAWSGKFSHTRPNGTDWHTALSEMDYSLSSAGENIASGYTSVKSVSKGWKDSQGHYENMTAEHFNKAGFGLVELDGIKYWVQLFSN